MLISIGEMFDSTGERQSSLVSVYSYKYRGKSDTRYDNSESILSSPLCPQRGDRDPYNRGAYIDNVKAERQTKDEPNEWWIISVDSSTGQQDQVHPLQRPVVIERTSDREKTFTTRDNKGNPILNKAGDLIAMPVEISTWVLSCTKNLKSTPEYLDQFNDAINKSTVTIKGRTYKKKTLKCSGIKVNEAEEDYLGVKIKFETVTFQLYYNPLTWIARHPNVGYNQLITGLAVKQNVKTGKILRKPGTKKLPQTEIRTYKVPILINGEQPTEPQALDKYGRYIANPGVDDILYIEADVYPELDFNQLPLT